MTPTLGSYLAGCASLVAMVGALGFGAYHLRRWIVPEFSGALARLAEIVIGLTLLTLTLELIGTAGLFRRGWIIGATIVVGVVSGLIGRRRAGGAVRAIAPPDVGTVGALIAVGVASFTIAEWSFPSQLNLDQGMFGGDSTWYHMPFSLGFVQEGSTNGLHYTDPLRLVAWFYPQGWELINGALVAVMQSDWLSPLLNLAWVAIGLLACWCIGRPYGVAPATLVAGALVFDSGVFIETQAGEGRNDAMGIALLVAFAAFLVNGHQAKAPSTGAVAEVPDPDAPLLDKGPLMLAGLAGGLAIAVKLPLLAPVGAIAVGMIVVSSRARRLTTAWVLGASIFATGAFWYLRNVFHTGGNPIPQIGFGPLHLPRPDQMPLDPRPRFSVSDYITDPSIYRNYFFPRLDDALGPLYPLILVMAFVATIYVAVRSRNKVLRVLTGAALLTALVYLATPLTAAGPEGEPRGFFTNTRYLMPGLVLALVLLPLARPLRAPPERALRTVYFLAVLYAVTVLTTFTGRWYPDYFFGTVFLTLALIWAPAAISWLRREGRIGRAGVAGIATSVLVAGVALGRAQEVQYFEQHYTKPTLFLADGGPVEAFAWARDQRDQRIGIAGSGEIFFGQYGLYGVDLSNEVEFVGVEGDNGEHRLAETCRDLRREVNEGDYDWLVISQYTQDDPEGDYSYPLRAWTRTEPALREVIAEEEITPQPAYVYEVVGRLDPAGCARIGKRPAPN